MVEVVTNDPYKSSTGFVTMTNLTSVSTAIGTQLCHIPDALNAKMAPDPRDIIWENIHIHDTVSEKAKIFAAVIVAVGAILWSIPVAFIQVYASVENLGMWLEK